MAAPLGPDQHGRSFDPIENAILTDAEVDWVDTSLADIGPAAFDTRRPMILDKMSKDRERSVEEVVGCREILGLVYQQANALFPLERFPVRWNHLTDEKSLFFQRAGAFSRSQKSTTFVENALTESALRGLHHLLLRFHPAAAFHAGGYKTSPNRVISTNHDTGERLVVLDPSPPGPLTETAMRDLIAWYNEAIHVHVWPLLVATEFVFRFLAIHPFQDGNGRLGRALFLLALLQGDDPAYATVVQFVSIDRQIERHRSLYYSVLQGVSGGRFRDDPSLYRFEPLAWFFLKMIEGALADVATLRRRYAALQRLSESAVRVLACFKSAPERRLKLADLVYETGLVRRTVQNALIRLTEAGLLQRLGAGPASRYQLLF